MENQLLEHKVSGIIYICYIFQLSLVGLIIWLVMKKDSPFIQKHGQQALSLYAIFVLIVLFTYSLGGSRQLLMLMAIIFAVIFFYLAGQAFRGKERYAAFLKHTL